MSDPIAWTAEARDNASWYDPRVQELLLDELCRRQDADALAEA
jgi:hypothetical protein